MLNILYRLFNMLRRTCQRLGEFSTVGVKALVINKEDHILLVEHTYATGWHLPGGGVNSGESPLAAIIREVKEETGLITKEEPQLFGVYSHKIYGAADYPILYIIRSFEPDPHHHRSPEIKRFQWFHYQQLPPETTEQTKQRIDEYFQQIPKREHW